uniref:Putative conserved plasma membrane protein n=1 Tax=Xenopsylla cheopis TaxID=163159 RepID=A0A6M2DP53_XENCH
MTIVQDEETGEFFSNITKIDTETGEKTSDLLEQNKHVAPIRKFHIPKEYLKTTRKSSSTIQEAFPICDRKKYYALNEDIILGQNTMSHRLLLFLPVLFVFPKLPTVLIAIFEILVHMWCHKKNKQLSDPGLYYRSPLHIVTSEYCAYCRNQKQMDKISKIQDKRKFRHLKSTYNYVTT